MRDLNPMQFFRGPAPEAKPDISQEHKEAMAGQKKPMTKVPSLLFDIEVSPSQRRLYSSNAVILFQRRQ